ncbi:uncharacterized protein LOC124922691 isoform X1 [Impatiens glandulifera]|uniref:uncharacterized protein LOC124922691 isoform X1 n=1 Tax=Impatiens glandulifera TaxID=253017 RepID=UPI001FB0832E|nr:uncharacterized protein LOC124922691 isoform X1 [Impatiens glandulifera]
MPKPPLADFLQPPISSSRRSSLAIVLLSRRSTRRHRSPPTANLRRCSPSVANSSCDLDDVVLKVNSTSSDVNNTVNAEQYMQDFIHDMFFNVNDGSNNHELVENA